MGSGGGIPKGIRKPSQTAYFVALGGILILLFLLCLYFFYFFIKKVKELSRVPSEALMNPTSCRPPPAPAPYPVAPVVRDSASAMAKLCKQVPTSGKTDTVFPTSTSPAALRTDVGTDAAPQSPVEAPDSNLGTDTNTLRPDGNEAGEVKVPPASIVVTNEVVSAR